MSSALKYPCPVCGFMLKYPADDFNICPSCGVEFGADTVEYTIEELRQAWISRGMQWTSSVIPQAEHYNPVEQLQSLEARKAKNVAASNPETELNQAYASPPRFRPTNVTTTGRLELRRA
jgi:hypothetical protein